MSRYELELNENAATLDRIHLLFNHLYEILRIQNNDSNDSIEGGAAVHYKIDINIEEKWV